MTRRADLPEHTLDAALHAWISAWAVSAVMGGLIVTTGWRY